MTQYTTIDELQAKSAEAKKEVSRRRTKCRLLWLQLTTTTEKKGFKTPTQRLLSNADKAAMLFDGVMFGTKLYNLFRNKKEGKKKSMWKRIFSIF